MPLIPPGTSVKHVITGAQGTLLSYNYKYGMYYVFWDHGTATLINIDYVKVIPSG